MGQYSIVEYTRNQELKIHLSFGSVYSGLIFAKCVDNKKSTSIKSLYTEDAVSILQLLHLPWKQKSLHAMNLLHRQYSWDIFVKVLRLLIL